MNDTEQEIIEQAAAWHLASLGDEMDWDAFTRWLEADSRHRAAFDEMALADTLIADHPEALEPIGVANDDWVGEQPQPYVGRRSFAMRWAGGAIAATLVAAMAVWQIGPGNVQTYATGMEARRIALDDGSQIELAPHSSLKIEGRDQQRIALDGGAWFDIRHDPSRQLAITAGQLEISDIGTQFDVQSAAGQVRVQVAEGRVRVSSDALGKPLSLAAGHGVTFDPAGGTAEVASVQAGKAGEWREGRLSFDAAPLPLVAADLSRYAGVRVSVADNARNRRFTGTLVIQDGETALRDLSQLMDLELGRSGKGYRLEVRNR
ncbi:FecR domain-containing protein [Erythrobacter sp. SG61-1L]|uniref:FecR family protein n=1 Tax=Erythrobacter sp. SG61-1L TaxID=1603897 RepID=UPI0006C91AE8|nr:FecR domain-containing protein [Erythrobacter sp. SG61-1L]